MIILFSKKNDTTATTMTAPKIDGTNAIPARLGPHAPKSDCPTDEPIKPAMILAIIPMEPPFSDSTSYKPDKASDNNRPKHNVPLLSKLSKVLLFG